jgi:epsin
LSLLFAKFTLLDLFLLFSFNQAKPKTDVEARVYEVLSHKNWGSSSSLMHEVARDTFEVERFHVVTRLMWEGVENQRPAAWRVVFKALTLLEFLIKNGAERCVDDARNHGHVMRQLAQFNYYEGTIDRGLGVREKTKQITDILGDDERIREERQKAKQLRQKFGSGGATASGGGGRNAGYGNQDSWNNSGGGTGGGGGGAAAGSGSGYGQGGIDSESSPYAGRYAGGSRGGGGGGGAAAAPTFASIPDGKPKKTKKKKKKSEAAAAVPAAAPAPGTLFLCAGGKPGTLGFLSLHLFFLT